MAKKCPPGVFCIEHITLILLFLLLILCIFYLRKSITSNIFIKVPDTTKNHNQNNNFGLNNQLDNIYNNLYNYNMFNQPPLKKIPINIPTSQFDYSYQQVGILTRNSNKDTILALYGRPVHANRNKWQYYTMTDKTNSIRLPVSKNGKSGNSSYGVDEIYNGDTIYVEGYNDVFIATIYDNDTLRYLPVF